jgi:transmembrane sensor
MSKDSANRNDRSLQIEEQASFWLARRDSVQWSQRDQESFDQWLSESTRHRVEYLRLSHIWGRTARMQVLGAGLHSQHPPPPGQWNLSPFFTQRAEDPDRTGGRLTLRLRALAAGVMLAAVAGSAWYFWPPGNTFATPVGAVASLPMSDGSKVTLNTDTEVKVLITETERRIDLRHGEAFFEVAKDPDRPFVVTVDDKRVIALGTKFSVRREAAGIQVIVTEGAVRVESVSGAGVENIAPRRLTAGTMARTNRSGLMVQTQQLPQAEEQLAWRSGVLVLRDVTLAEAAAEFNRYNDRKFVIKDAAAAQLRVGGNFRTTDVDAFVRLLEQGYPVRAAMNKGEIVVSDR